MNLRKLRKKLDSRLSERDYIKKEVTGLKREISAINKRILNKEKAYIFLKEVTAETQKQLEFNLNDMVATGLNSVFDTKYDFDTHFEIKRDRPECTMSFKKKGKLIDPLAFSGLGAADVAAFSLRAASLSMAEKYRRILFLDEPFQRLKGEKENKRVIELMQTISQKLNIQIICVNDERAAREDIIDGADRVFHVEQFNNISKVRVL